MFHYIHLCLLKLDNKICSLSSGHSRRFVLAHFFRLDYDAADGADAADAAVYLWFLVCNLEEPLTCGYSGFYMILTLHPLFSHVC